MKCPVCGIDLTPVKKNGIEVDYCEQCKGVWFDLTEIEQLSDTISQFNIVAPRFENLKIAKTEEKPRPCPRCTYKMEKVTMLGKPPIFDCCPNNCGYWFDADELKEYVNNNMTAVNKPSMEVLSEIIKK